MGDIAEYIKYFFMFASIYFEVFLLYSFLEKKKNIKDERECTPGVTVIVPCYNEESTVEKTILSLLALDYPRENLKILVVNDGSTDKTANALKQFENHSQIKIFHKTNGGKYTALNFGIKKATTAYVGCLDADSFVDKNALKLIMNHFAKETIMAVVPSMIVHNPNNILRKMQRAEYYYGNFMRKTLSNIGAVHITPGPFSFFRKDVFEKIGYYRHAHNTEDMEMAMRMQKNGMKIVSESDARVYTVGPDTVRKLYKQRVRWVSGFLANLLDYKDMLFNKKHGDLGIIVLPFVGLMIIMTLSYIFMSLVSIGKFIWEEALKISVVGWNGFSFGTFEWFYLSTSFTTMLTIILVLAVLSLIFFGQKISTGKYRISFESLYFITLYSILAPFWLIKSIYNNLFSRMTAWR